MKIVSFGWSDSECELLGALADMVDGDVVGGFGVTKLGEPWFVLERPDGSAMAHFVKVNHRYVCAPSLAGGLDTCTGLQSLIDRFVTGMELPKSCR